MNARTHLSAFAFTLCLLLGSTALRAQETNLIDNKPCDMHGSAREGAKEYAHRTAPRRDRTGPTHLHQNPQQPWRH